MKLKQNDYFNLCCLKLHYLKVWDSPKCLTTMRWGRMTRKRTQERYLQRLVTELYKMEQRQPQLLEDMFKEHLLQGVNDGNS